MNWQNAITDFQLFLKIERGLSTNTIESYSRDLSKLLLFLERNEIELSPIVIDENTIQQFIYEIAKKGAVRSQARIIAGLRSFFDYLIFEDYRATNPTDLIETPKLGLKLPDTLSTAEIDALIAAIDLSHPQGERNKGMLETMYSCGLRVSELTSLKISDLFFEEGFIRVIGKGNKQRFIPIHVSTQRIINGYVVHFRKLIIPNKGSEDTLFLNRRGNGLSRQMVFMILKKLAINIGLEKKISPHTFRHSFATHLLKGGADLRVIQQMLGHESITTTEVYLHIDKSDLQEVVEKFHPRK
ncbi:site-specific tyrosine recombinase XerD [Polaribacter sp.]|nr:site-specific tyrosine recombinase XerD [Polaribacter sp.]